MRILMVIPRYVTDVDEYYEFPLGLCLLSACAKAAGHEVAALNLNHVEGSISVHIERVIGCVRPDAFATGGLSPHYALLKAMFTTARQADPHLVLMGGGGIISSEPELMTQALGLDIGFIGEGEDALVEVLNTLEQTASLPAACRSEALRSVPGLCLGGAEPVLTSPRSRLADLDALPFPDYAAFGVEQYLDRQKPNDNYYLYPFDKPRILPVIASRSCPYSCTFCYHPLGNVYRRRSLEGLFAEIDMLVRQYGINMLAILDELFGVDLNSVDAFCSRMEKYNLKWLAQMRVDRVNPQILDTMRRSGLFYISYGLESASPQVLHSMRKHIKLDQMEKALADTQAAGIGIQGNFIFGDAAETLDTANQTLDWWCAHARYGINLTSLIPYPGSPIYHDAVNKGIIPEKLSFIEKGCPTVPLSQMSVKDVSAMYQRIAEVQEMHRIYGEVISIVRQKENSNLFEFTIRCPHCGQVNVYKNFCASGAHTDKVACRLCNQRFDYDTIGFSSIDINTITMRIRECIVQKYPVALAPYLPDMETKKYLRWFGVMDIEELNIQCVFDNMTEYHHLFQFGRYPVKPRTLQSIQEGNKDTIYIIMPCFAYERLVKNLREEFLVPEERLIYVPFE